MMFAATSGTQWICAMNDLVTMIRSAHPGAFRVGSKKLTTTAARWVRSAWALARAPPMAASLREALTHEAQHGTRQAGSLAQGPSRESDKEVIPAPAFSTRPALEKR